MKAIALLGIGLGAAIAAVPAQAQGDQPLQFVDFTDDFDRAWEQTKDLPDATRVQAFQAEFAKALPGFYSEQRVGEFIKPDRYRAMILEGLKKYPEQRAGIQRVSRQFDTLVTPARREFEEYFGPMRGYPAIYLVHSFGEFDGGTRDLRDGMHLMFGADMIDRFYADKPIKPFVEHELFHLMHERTFKDCAPLWCNLWEEGLATYVAATFNPGADDAALGMTIPAPIRPAVEANKSAAICAVRERLQSETAEDYAPLFYGSRKLPGLPARMGYYVGFLVVQDIGKSHDLKQLAALQPAQVGPLIEQSLARMADCPAKAPGERG